MKRDRKHILYKLDEDDYSYRGVWLLAILYFGSLVAGAILSLIVFKLTHYFDPEGTSYLASKPYTRFFDRARWVSVLVMLPFLFKSCRLTSFKAIGFAPPFAKTYFRWMSYGIAMILLVYVSNTILGAFAFEPKWMEIFHPKEIGEALLASILIGLLEEIVFRALVFRTFYTAFRPWIAITLSSLFFAVLHFKAPSSVVSGEIGVWESAKVAWETVSSLVTQFNPAYLLTIFLVGVVLHQAFLLKRNLWASIGLHAGWVFTLKLIGSSFSDGDSVNPFFGSTRLVDGYWVCVVLLVFIAIFGYKLHKEKF